jgi:1-acyl-sn-glycerol-3-phosphate acyltransferase
LLHSNRSWRLAPRAYAPRPPGRLKYLFIRYALRFLIRCYLRVRVVGVEHLPADPPYLLNFSHPNWVDPFLVIAFWPTRHGVFILGPKEEDMGAGWRNHIISWGQLAVPFKPSKSDLIDTTKRATSVFTAGYVLGIAGEGRLSDREGEIVPLQDGAAFFALRGRVPVVPLAIVGTRWLRFGKQVTLRVGPTLSTDGLRPDRAGVALLTERLQAAMGALLAGVQDEPPPGPFGRWVTDLFNERPWLNDPPPDDEAGPTPPLPGR